MSGVEGSEGHHKEGGGVFPSIHQMREGSLGVTVTPQALDEAEPGGETLDDGAQTVRVAVAHVVTGIYNRTQQNLDVRKASLRFLTPPHHLFLCSLIVTKANDDAS